MYNDPAQTTTDKQRRIEAMFSKMESQASTLFRRIVKNHEAGDTTVTLSRTELDFIRKFLFLLKYRGSTFHQTFYRDALDDYPFNDRELLFDYMREHNFSSPRDVWYHNLETIINLEMDPQRKWLNTLPQKMFPNDALWCTAHVGNNYMAICTPSEAADEFILTENCYNVFEGLSNFVVDKATGQVAGGNQAAFHEFAPISPRLMIILRSLALPNSADPHSMIIQGRQDMFWSTFGQVYGPDATSMLDDLPIKQCRNSYSEIINGKARPVAGFDGKYRPGDKFHFTYYPIRTDHVRIINSIFLDNAYKSSVIAYRNQDNLKGILESYVSGPCDIHKVLKDDWDNRYSFLRELETLSKLLGSQKSLVWRTVEAYETPTTQNFTNKDIEFRRLMQQRIMKGGTHHDQMTTFLELYKKLGRNSMLDRDIAQAGKMVYFQWVVKELSIRCDETVQMRNRTVISKIFKAFYCSRYWLYLKLFRKSQCGDQDGTQDEVELLVNKDIREGPEDIFVQTSQLYDENTLNNLMYTTVLNDIEIRKSKIANLWAKAVDTKSIFFYVLLRSIIFTRPGNIRDCGIPDVERLAKQAEQSFREKGTQSRSIHLPFANGDEILELMVRVHVRSKFNAAMAGKAKDGVLGELKDILFRLTFPTPPLD
ncbi:uncharacterized protein Triagg1_7331 [Trichoderma aggressivum f. europaeum]|uniref:Uncharacterized protein n=1 Tax=Trichoderma aggressivum f. europaeum TaxID=173218 RepID=A0AAE1M0X4_9HYPO|nr:hypothetical protein Triagg1_7331 [Trichoderma aggressivum f. europaeum]